MPFKLSNRDLASRGKNTSGINQCYGSYNDTSQTGWGPTYQYNCTHSGNIRTSGDVATTWYNYTLASAGTITDENTTSSNPATNTNPATESICPKGWTLPSKTQIDSQRNIASFSPVLGGYYDNGPLYNEGTRGIWWGSTAYNGAARYGLNYNGSILYTNGSDLRRNGYYVRCINKQKTVLDLTYMQEMTPEIGSNDLVSHGTSGQECYATTASGGAGYINSCIHSDSNGYSGDNTVWYNYVIASAGTIVNNSATDTTGNLNTATESVCPKGWTLPSKIQIDNQRNVASFSPVLGGNYSNGALFAETTLGPWWGSEAIDGDSRYYLRYDGSNLFTNNNDGRRRYGFYIRCVSEEKAITSLTYMQDMTPAIVAPPC